MTDAARPVHLVTLVGGRLDRFTEEDRHTRWRPSLALARHFRPERIELVTVPRFAALADALVADIADSSPETQVVVHRLATDPGWDFVDNFTALADVARACAFEPDTHDVLVHITNGNYVAQICLFLLAESRQLPGRLVASSEREVAEPFRVIDLELARYDRIAARFEVQASAGTSFLKQGIATRNAAYNQLIARLERVITRSRKPVLLTGETGAGKSVLARRCYDLLVERGLVRGPFVEINCATLSGDQAMSTLFGHERGAYTGATDRREGLLRQANGGVVFLDEIGDLSPEVQAKLLRALETKKVRPLGSDREYDTDFRLICGTHRDLRRDVRRGRFREDLLARISMWHTQLPALRDRREDLEPNLDFELERCARELDGRVQFSREARALYLGFALAFAWAGNFRDLAASLERMATLCEGGRITEADVREEIAVLEAAEIDEEASTSADALQRRSSSPGGAPVAGTPVWPPPAPLLDGALGPEARALDVVERVVLEAILLALALTERASDAGRLLYEASRLRRAAPNDSQRVLYALERVGLMWDAAARRVRRRDDRS